MGSRSGGAWLVSGSGGMRRRGGMWTLASATGPPPPGPPFGPACAKFMRAVEVSNNAVRTKTAGDRMPASSHIMGITINVWPRRPVPEIYRQARCCRNSRIQRHKA